MIQTKPKDKSLSTLIHEVWRDITGFPGYQVSNVGRVKSLDRSVWNRGNGSFSLIRGKILTLDTFNKPYAQVGLAKESRMHKKLVHRLVAIQFVPNPENLPEVNHEDLDKRNNKASNLTWASRLSNAQHAKENGRYSTFPSGEDRYNAILTKDGVLHIRRKELRNIEYCKMYGVAPSTVSCLQSEKYGDRWTSAKLS